MKKIKVNTIFLLFTINLCSQSNFVEIDKYAFEWNHSVNSTSEMYDFLDSIDLKYEREIDKVRVFYVWLVNNIDYDYEKKENSGLTNYYDLYGNSEIARNDYVLRNKKGVCGDYSRLFKFMGEYLSLEVEYVSGFARTFEDDINFLKKIEQEDSNHAWNYINLDGRDYFIDATWGVNNNEDDLETYFLITPNKMITTHFPENTEQQYLKKKVSLEQFKSYPYTYKLYKGNYFVLDYSPKRNIILEEGKKYIRFSLKISQYANNKFTMILRENNEKKDILICDQVNINGDLVIDYKLEDERNIDEIVIYLKENDEIDKKILRYKIIK